MMEVLQFMYDNFFGSGLCPPQDALHDRLLAAGFKSPEVAETLAWLQQIDAEPASASTPTENHSPAATLRCLSTSEIEKLGKEGWSLLECLVGHQVLTVEQRELILTGLFLLPEYSPADMERLKLMILTVLWRQGDTSNALSMEDLLYFQDELLH